MMERLRRQFKGQLIAHLASLMGWVIGSLLNLKGKYMRLYHLVSINEKTGNKVYLTGYPMSHKECCTMKSKFTYHSFRRIQLEEVTK